MASGSDEWRARLEAEKGWQIENAALGESLAETVEALKSARTMIVTMVSSAMILYDGYKVEDHPVVAQIDQALAKARPFINNRSAPSACTGRSD